MAKPGTDSLHNRIVEMRMMKPGELADHPRNWRKHPARQVRAVRGVLKEVGIADALLAWPSERNGGKLTTYDGHLRKKIAPDVEWPVLITNLTDAEADYMIATLDTLTSAAEVDTETLQSLLADIKPQDAAVAELLGVAVSRANEDMGGIDTEPQIDKAEELQKKWGTARGQVWALGDHRLMCGDSTSADDVTRLMQGERAQLIHADPPYGMGKEKDGVANDNLYSDKLDAFQMAWWRVFRPYAHNNASAYIWGNAEDLWRLWYRSGLCDSERLTFRNEIVWAKGSAGAGGISHMGADGFRQYPNETERCLFFMLGEQGFNNNADNYWEGWDGVRKYLKAEADKMALTPSKLKEICGVGMYSHWFTESQWTFIPAEHYTKLRATANGNAFKREYDDLKREFYATRAYFDNTHDNMTDVWSFGRVTGEERHGHATPKPVDMICRAVKSSSQSADIIVEPFGGSGTTLIACEQTGRKCRTMEIAPEYVAVALQRWGDATGKTPELIP